MPRKKNYSKGFTLVELLVVFGILSVIVGGLVATINPFAQLQKAHDAQRKNDLSQIQKGLELYYQDHGQYPPSSATYLIAVSLVPLSTISWGSSWSPYLTTLPKDPTGGRSYVYYVTDATGQSYRLYASLERPSDINMCNGGLACVSSPAGNPCGAAVKCNYGVSSPNVSP